MSPIARSKPIVLRLITIACLIVIVVLSWAPRGSLPGTGIAGLLQHVAAYAFTGFLAARSGKPGLTRWFGLGFLLLAGALELGQVWVPGHVAELSDFAASSAGAVVGLAAPSWLVPAAARPLGPGALRSEDRVARALLQGLLIFGALATPVWIAFLLWLAGSGLIWLFR